MEDKPTGVWAALRAEWRSRTWYGKLWFPVWAVAKAGEGLSFLVFFGFLYLVAVAPHLASAVRGKLWAPFRATITRLRGLTPAVYDGSDEEA